LERQLLSFVDPKKITKERMYMCCEKRYPTGHQYLHFTNNMDYIMLEQTALLKGVDMAHIDTLQAFSHWTYQVRYTPFNFLAFL
jgi:hypothetical protein